jgi:hypothetical protein
MFCVQGETSVSSVIHPATVLISFIQDGYLELVRLDIIERIEGTENNEVSKKWKESCSS